MYFARPATLRHFPMRPKPQSFLRHPLSTLLGTEASVRVLRELALHGNELTTPVLAQRTGITGQAVRNILNSLLTTGVLKVYGQGRATSYRLDLEHPVGRSLLNLFHAEEERVEMIRQAVASAARQMSPPPLAVWVFGSVARGEDRPESDLDLLLVLEDDETAEREAGFFREMLDDLQKEQQITLSIVPLSSSDIERLSGTADPFWKEMLRDAIPWHGERPEALARRVKRRRGDAPRRKKAPRG